MNLAHYGRHALRAFRARPALALLCIGVTALGIGAATAVSSAVYALLARPLPLAAADRLVTGFALREGFDPFGTSLLEFDAFRRGAGSFDATGLARQQTWTLRTGADTLRLQGASATADYLTTAGVTPIAGRLIEPADDRPGAMPVAVIGHALWRRAFGGRVDIIGTTRLIDGQPATIIGVLPPHFDLPSGAELWMPLRLSIDTLPFDQRLAGAYAFIARLRPGVSLELANQDVRIIAQRLAEEHAARRGWTYRVIGLRQQLLGDLDGRTSGAIAITAAAVGLLLVICGVNVANLIFLRMADRRRDTVIRLAIGASPAQVAGERLVECGMIGLAGGAGGVLLAMWLTPLLASLNPIRADAFAGRLTDFRVDGVMILVALALSLAATVAFALAAATRTSLSPDLSAALTADGRRAGQSRAHARRLRMLVGAQIAVAVVLLIGGGLIARSFRALRGIDPGFRPDGLVAMQLTLPVDRYADHRRRAAAMDALVAAVESIPGVGAAGMTTNIPLQRVSFDSIFTAEGQPQLAVNDVPITAHRVVTPGYLDVLGVRLVQGRLLSPSDHADAPRVVVVTEALARQAWPGRDPIGRRIRRGRAADTRPWFTVVGVVADVKEDRFNFRIDRAAWYLPYAQEDSAIPPNLVVRAATDPSEWSAAVRERLRSIDPDIAASGLLWMDEQVAELLTTERFAAILLVTLASAGLLLAALGLYGAISHVVLAKNPEIALRMAVGAARPQVIGIVVREVALVAAGGIAVGSAIALAGSRAIGAVMYGVSPYDPATFGMMLLLVAGVSGAAAWLPAMRAATVDPARLLR
jgi:predicted permease